jgi:sugar lactone lactonase YvrE
MDNLERKIKSGSLYCLDKNLKVHKIDGKYFITNGPAFLDKNNFYHTDTRKGEIYKIKINKKLKIVKKIKFLKFDKKDGFPDGMTTDIKNNLWVCHYGGACISVYNLRAKKIHKINLPAKNITNCTFAGHKNNELYISTARKGLKSHDLKKYPLSGSLFKVKTNLKGKKSVSFKALYSVF